MRFTSTNLPEKDTLIITKLYQMAKQSNPELTLKQFTTNLIVYAVNEAYKLMEKEQANANTIQSEHSTQQADSNSILIEAGDTGTASESTN